MRKLKTQQPQIINENGISTLYVNGEPFICLSGEIHNSNASSLDYLRTKVWPNLRSLNMNSVIIPIYWELIEKNEGEFDFTLIDEIINDAREEKLKIIFIWFGLWKNAESMYAPQWMKKNTKKYFRVQSVTGELLNVISPLCTEAIQKDGYAFSKVMKHIRQIDENENTVIMVQVENEIGILGSNRDYSQQANDLFKQTIPTELMKETFNANSNWETAFGDDAEEYFMAYYFAKAVEQISSMGKEQYNLPMYTNAWLKQYPWYPGSYPSGGPTLNVHWIWKKVAPSLFTLAPDIYVPYVSKIIDEYSYEGNPLFIPEVRKDSVTASYALYSFFEHNAIGYSPFGIEELVLDPNEIDKPPLEVMIALNIDPSAFDITDSKNYLSSIYYLIENMKKILFKYRGTHKIHNFIKHSETDFGKFIQLSQYDLVVSYLPKQQNKPISVGTIIELTDDKFLVIGMMADLKFKSKANENKKADIIELQEGHFENNIWIPKRFLNGDEKMSVKLKDAPTMYMIQLYKY